MKTRSIFRSSYACGLLAGAALVATTLGGCIAVSTDTGAGVVAYVRGDLEATLANDFNPVVAATGQAIKHLGFTKISEKKDASDVVIVVRTANDKKVEISITSNGKSLTVMKIRVDLFGDEQLSRTILDQIKTGL
jgi:siroheme synthase (precorrin-2 oxidase/ferrochelatase)